MDLDDLIDDIMGPDSGSQAAAQQQQQQQQVRYSDRQPAATEN